MTIKSDEVSVVVQGPVVGAQGRNRFERLTQQSLAAVRKVLPGAELIFSTWSDAPLEGLDFDVLVESADPGATQFSSSPRLLNNVNRQIVSTQAGLDRVTRPYVLKLRSDIELRGDGFLRYFDRFPERSDDWSVFERRVVTCTIYSRNPRRVFPFPFHPSDWVHFGLKTDIDRLWGVPLAPEPETSQWFATRPRPAPDVVPMGDFRYTPEQYIWATALRRHRPLRFDHLSDTSGDNLDLSELTMVNNFTLLSPSQFSLYFLKYPVSHLDWASCYSHWEWRLLVQRHCVGSPIRVPNLPGAWRAAYAFSSRAAMASRRRIARWSPRLQWLTESKNP